MGKNGFTLLEVLIATIILTLGIIAIVWAFSAGIFATTDVEDSDLALNIGQANMEEIFQTLKETDLTTLDIPGFEAAHSGLDPNFSKFNVTTDLTDVNGDGSLMQVDITVNWATKGGTANVALATFVADL